VILRFGDLAIYVQIHSLWPYLAHRNVVRQKSSDHQIPNHEITKSSESPGYTAVDESPPPSHRS
jgi:hypothetical protein